MASIVEIKRHKKVQKNKTILVSMRALSLYLPIKMLQKVEGNAIESFQSTSVINNNQAINLSHNISLVLCLAFQFLNRKHVW